MSERLDNNPVNPRNKQTDLKIGDPRSDAFNAFVANSLLEFSTPKDRAASVIDSKNLFAVIPNTYYDNDFLDRIHMTEQEGRITRTANSTWKWRRDSNGGRLYYPTGTSIYGSDEKYARINMDPHRGKRYSGSGAYGPYLAIKTDGFILDIDRGNDYDGGVVDGIYGVFDESETPGKLSFDFIKGHFIQDSIETQLNGSRGKTIEQNGGRVKGRFEKETDNIHVSIELDNGNLHDIVLPRILDNKKAISELTASLKGDPLAAPADADHALLNKDWLGTLGISWKKNGTPITVSELIK